MRHRLVALVVGCLLGASCSSAGAEPEEIAASAEGEQVTTAVSTTASEPVGGTGDVAEPANESESEGAEGAPDEDASDLSEGQAADGETPVNECVDCSAYDMATAEQPLNPLDDSAVKLELLDSSEDIDLSFVRGSSALGASVVVDGPPGLHSDDVQVSTTIAGAHIRELAVSEIVSVAFHPEAPAPIYVEMSLEFDPARVSEEFEPHIWTLDVEAGVWSVVEGEHWVYPGEAKVYAVVDRFSCHAVLAADPTEVIPVTEESACRPTVERVAPGFIQVPGLDIPQSVLLQPASMGPDFAVTSSPRWVRADDGSRYRGVVTFTEVVSFNPDFTIHTGDGCSATCELLVNAGPEAVFQAVLTQKIWALD